MEYLKSPHILNLAAEFETWGNSISIEKKWNALTAVPHTSLEQCITQPTK
jgi:hypothetical protein